MKLFFKAEPL